MPERYLYEKLAEEFGRRFLAQIRIPTNLTDNLNPSFELRQYQIDAFQRFICYFENEFDFKQRPSHLLFNMATGSGKTLIMAGLILYLYEQGYRNFLFFVNSTNIIEKTKDNFLNQGSIKYLFNQGIHLSNRPVRITPVENFEAANPNDINICFTTIQKLHSDLNTERENALTFEDFRKHKIVLIADEAHHMNVQTRSQTEMFESWENTVESIFKQNEGNLLLEFTATHDYATPAMIEKYLNKVLIRYDLLQFRNDRFSKDVVIVQSDFNLNERILQALIMNQYKQEVAAKYRINLKPVILFKAQRTIDQSKENKANFHSLIDGLTVESISRIRKSNIPIVRRAFGFFDESHISDGQLVERLKRDFQEDFCLSVNDDTEKEKHQILLNTLEDKTNRIRAIFAVKKLNEGWDVLNLFDIVRCYEPRDTGRPTTGSTTLSEAQLIGRGARYFPFVLPDGNDRYSRKFDGDLTHELRVLEELHYHSINNSRYIAEIRQALVEQGMMDEEEVVRQLKLKENFKETDFYKYGFVWINDRRPKNYQGVRSFLDLGVRRKNFVHEIATGQGGATTAMDRNERNVAIRDIQQCDLKVSDIPRNIIQAAIARNPFFTFASLKRYFPNITSMLEFISSERYLGGLEITFRGNIDGVEENRAELLLAVLGLINTIESEIRSNVTDNEGTHEFHSKRVFEIFEDKLMKFDVNNILAREDHEFNRFVLARDWYAFNTLYGTSEEKSFVFLLDRFIDRLNGQFDQIYLLRNEGYFAIYDFSKGRAFQPDFVLFLHQKDGDLQTLQIFIEPKGTHIADHDRWKEDFLKEIAEEFEGKTLTIENKKYRLIGVPFFNSADENEFKASLESVLN